MVHKINVLSLQYQNNKTTTNQLTTKIMKAPKISISDFDFTFAGYGHYTVTYTSPVTGKKFECSVTDMQIIDATKNADEPKVKDLNRLKRLVKN